MPSPSINFTAGTTVTSTWLNAVDRNVFEDRINVKDYGATGDGSTNDTTAILDAVAALSSGKTLYFPPGNYSVNIGYVDTTIVLPIGSNLFMEAGAWLIPSTSYGSIITPLGSNIIKCNINGSGFPSSGGVGGTWTRENVGIRAYFNTSLGLGSENVTIVDSEFKNLTYPIQTYGPKRWKISNNRFHNFKQTGVILGYYVGYDCLYNSIVDNNFHNGGDYAVAFFQVGGFGDGTGAYNIISNNVASDLNQRTNGYAYGVEAGKVAFQHHFVFSNNVYRNTTGITEYSSGGITISTCSDSLVIGNLLVGDRATTADVGINCIANGTEYPTNNQISNNIVENFRAGGIRTDGCNNILVTGNSIKNCGGASSGFPAILIGASFLTKNVTVTNNQLLIESTYPYYGAGVPSIGAVMSVGIALENINIKENVIVNPNDYGIFLSCPSATPGVNINIEDNVITGTSDVTFFQRNPIYVAYCNAITIANNKGYNCRTGWYFGNVVGGEINFNELKGTLTVATLLDITGSTSLSFRNNSASVPITAVFAGGSSAQLTTGANNNSATGTSGMVVENKGITSGITTGSTVAHGLSVTPKWVMVTAAETGPTDITVSSVGATTFVINFGGGGSKAFYWEAKL